MSAKHTPGPWQVRNELDDTIVVGNVDGESFPDGTHHFHYDFICDTSVDDYGEPTDPDTAKANARLIAAAPELLAALKAAHAALDSIYETEGFLTEERATLARIEAAIAKAKGRS
jgi:hypothetical protein